MFLNKLIDLWDDVEIAMWFFVPQVILAGYFGLCLV
jgi:hypothetical protein